MAEFDRQIATALRLIQKKGQKVVWRQLPAAVSDPLQPWNGGASVPVNNDVFICFVPVRDRETRKLFQYLTGTEIEIGQLAGLMGNVPFDPKPKDIVLRDGVELRIASLDLLSPNGQKILWTVEFHG
jgi:hypothetical protein